MPNEIAQMTDTPIRKLSQEAEDDFELTRRTYRSLIEAGAKSMDQLSSLAEESEHPRAFEVLSNLIKSVGDTTDKLIELHKTREDIINKSQGPSKGGFNNPQLGSPDVPANIFVGTTSDLQRIMQDQMNKEKVVSTVESDDSI